MSSFGQIRAGSLLLYDQTIEATDVDLGDLQFTNLSIGGTTRLRTTGAARCVVSYHHAYSKETQLNVEVVGTNASSTHNATDAHVAMAVTGANGRVVRQTIPYVPYGISASTIVYMGAVLSTNSPSQPSNIRARVGVFDDIIDKTGGDVTGNGWFFQLFGGVLSVVSRTSTAGATQTDTVVTRASFSDDKLDGTGATSFTLATNVMQTYFVDLSFCGSGVVRLGVMDGTTMIIAHTFVFRTTSTPVVRYATLPVRFEIQNTTASAQTDTMRVSSASVWQEGRGVPRAVAASTGSTPVAVVTTTRVPLLSVRVRLSTIRALAFLRCVEVLVDRECLVEILHGTTLTGASWTQIGTVCEVDTSATGVSGGRVLKVGAVERRASWELESILENAVTAAGIDGTSSIILSVCASKIDANALAVVCASLEELL
jgi:hypothetical protein